MGKILNRPLWLAMERVTEQSKGFWLALSVRHAPREQGRRAEMPEGGLRYFQKVLEEVLPNDNEIWIAYVTSEFCPKFFVEQDDHNQLQMYMTVTSRPDALVTSHMGISRILESFTINQHRVISMDLHAFAAKVMLMRNSKRRYMVNAPEVFMESIMLQNLPRGSIFIGTRELMEG